MRWRKMMWRFAARTAIILKSGAKKMNQFSFTAKTKTAGNELDKCVNKSFNYPRDISNMTREEQRDFYRGKGHQEHTKWIESKCYIEEISKIWEQQSMRFCPKWGFGGRKDEKWTRITWEKWKNLFCYFWNDLIDKERKIEHNYIKTRIKNYIMKII